MARNKTEVEDTSVDLPQFKDVDAIRESANQQNAIAVAINQEYGLSVYDRNAVEEKIRFYMGQSTEALLNSGKLLIQLKENEPHGEWMTSLKRLGIDQTLANRVMKAAVKFSNSALTHNLIEAAGNKTKLFELLVLDDEEVKELSEGGTVANIQLDDIARMSTTELRTALRKTKEDATASLKAKDDVIEAKAKELDAKNKSIDKLTEQLGHKKHSEEQSQPVELPETPLLRTLNERELHISSLIGSQFLSDITALYNVFNDAPPRHIELAIEQAIGRIITKCYDLADSLNIQPQIDPDKAAEDPAKQDAEDFANYEAPDYSNWQPDDAQETEEAEEIANIVKTQPKLSAVKFDMSKVDKSKLVDADWVEDITGE